MGFFYFVCKELCTFNYLALYFNKGIFYFYGENIYFNKVF